MTRGFNIASSWLAGTCLVGLFAGCALGYDMSVEGRHRSWVEERRNCIGKTLDSCRYWYLKNYRALENYPGLFLVESELGNGDKEMGFRFGRFDSQNPSRFPQCRYYYEYNPKTGVILGFRFEESERFACRISGA